MIIPLNTVNDQPMPTVTDSGGSRWKVAEVCLQKYYNTFVARDGVGLTKSNIPHPKVLRGTVMHETLRWYYNMLKGKYPDDESCKEKFDTNRPIDYNNSQEVRNWLSYSLYMGSKHLVGCGLEHDVTQSIISDCIQALDMYHDNYKHELVGDDDGLTVNDTEMYLDTVIDGERHTVRIDGVGTYGGTPIILDHKTTSKPWMLYVMSLRRDLSIQGYVYTAREYLNEPVQMLINGILFKNTKSFQVEFHRDLISYSQQNMDDFRVSLAKVHSDIAVCFDNNEWPKRGQSCVKDMILCEFYDLCTYPNTESVYENRLIMPTSKEEKGGEN